jgi:6-phosphofructokinase 1
MGEIRRVGIMTGGGDVPGLNSVIKSVVYRAAEMGAPSIGIRRGWRGLTHLRPGPEPDPEAARSLDPGNTRTIDRTGGTILHTSRTNPRRMREADLPEWLTAAQRVGFARDEDLFDLTPLVLDNLGRLGIDTLVAIGGDDTLSYARVLTDAGFPVVAIPKTMDNDVPGTEYCIGFSTAITRAKEAISRQRTTLGSHERIGVFRIFGRDAGFTSLYTAYVSSARCLIPEAPFNLDRLAAILAEDHAGNPSHYAFVIAAEGAVPIGMSLEEYGEADAYGHRRKADIGEFLEAELRARTGIETVTSELTYDLRSGEPDSLDQMVATTYANVAMDLVAEGIAGRMVGIVDGKYAHVPIPDPSTTPRRRVDVPRMYNVERFRPRYDGRAGEPLLLTSVADDVAVAR